MMSLSAIWMGLDIIILSEVRQTEKDKCQMISLTGRIYLGKMIELNLFSRQKSTYRYQEETYDYERGNVGGGRDKLGAWD